MSCELLPSKLVAELAQICGRSVHGSPDAGQRELAVSDPRREARRASPIRGVHLVASAGVPGQIERCERRVRRRLGADETPRALRLVGAHLPQVLGDPPHLLARDRRGQPGVAHHLIVHHGSGGGAAGTDTIDAPVDAPVDASVAAIRFEASAVVAEEAHMTVISEGSGAGTRDGGR